MKFEGSESRDVLPEEYSVRSKVHEYGGGASSMCHDGTIVFSDGNSSGVFRLNPNGDVVPVVNADAKLRYADFDAFPENDKWIIAVQEVHETDSVENRIVVIDAESRSSNVICSGADFYGHPSFSHDGKWISWIQWLHPDMPWTGSQLYVAEWKNGRVGQSKLIAGKPGEEAIGQPRWHSYGGLMFSSDKTGVHQLYMYDPASSETRQILVRGFEDAGLSITGYSGLGR